MKKTSFLLSVVGVVCLLSGCASTPASVEKTQAPDSSGTTGAPKIIGCDNVHTLYTDADAKKDVGGAWTGTDKAIDQGGGICSYAMVRAKAKPVGDDKYDYLSYVTVEYPTTAKADDYYASKKEKRAGFVDVAGVGEKAFLYSETKGQNHDTLILLAGNHVVSIECKGVCSDEQYKKIGQTIDERLR